MRKLNKRIAVLLTVLLLGSIASSVIVRGQNRDSETQEKERKSRSKDNPSSVRAITIPITTRAPKTQNELESIGNITVREDGEVQRVLSIRGEGVSPLTVAIILQDGVVPSVSSDVGKIADFIRRLPRGSRVLVGYIRSGSLQVRQKFTTDLERAAEAVRPPVTFASAAGFNPYVEIIEGLKRFDSQPGGRRAMFVVSDGLDPSRGLDISPQSLNLERAIKEGQRRGVAIYSLYAPSNIASLNGNSFVVGNAQGSLQRLSKETGGRAFFQGLGAPVSFDPFLREFAIALTRQVALTYLSTHPKKGYHRIQVTSDKPGVEIDHPVGHTR